MGIDHTQLQKDFPDTYKKLEEWRKQNPVAKQLQCLEDIADMVQEALTKLAENGVEDKLNDIGVILTDTREQLMKLNDREDPDYPDFSKPIIVALQKLETAINSIEVKPEFKPSFTPEFKPEFKPDIKVAAPDLKGIEAILRGDIPKAFLEAIKTIPSTDNTPIHEYLEALTKVMEEVRDKPIPIPQFPNKISVVNTDGSQIGSVGFDANADITITKTVVGNVTTFVKTDGVKTQTIEIDGDTGITTKVWS